MSIIKQVGKADMTRRRLLGSAVAVAVAPVLAQAAPKTRKAVKADAASRSESMRNRCQHASVALPGGLLLVCGGYARLGDAMPLASVQIYDPYQDQWHNVASMNTARARHSAALMPDGRVAVFGGVGTQLLGSVEIYDPGNNTWQRARAMRTGRADHSVQIIEDVAFITGGVTGTENQPITMGIETYRLRQDRRA